VWRDGVGMKIRGAAPGDSSDIAKINVLSWKAAAKGHIPAERMAWLNATIGERSPYWAAIANGEDDDHLLLVVEKAGEVIGFVHAFPSRDPGASSDTAEISSLFVCPESWGKGVGRALLGAALEELRRREYVSVTLWVLDFNERARRFYERAAFAPDGRSKVSEFNGIPLGEVRYELSLRWKWG
jgi:GNAT superfamily N-acetyltransferase